MKVVVLSHPDTTATGVDGLADALRRFAANIGCEVEIERIVTNKGVPKGQVFFADSNEPWVKNAGKEVKPVPKKCKPKKGKKGGGR